MKAIDKLIEIISQLSKRDQRWLNKKLAKNTAQLLAELTERQELHPASATRLPAFTKELAKEPALIIASVLLAENPLWQDTFLAEIDNPQPVRDLIKAPLPFATTKLIAELWRQGVCDNFESMLESQHG